VKEGFLCECSCSLISIFFLIFSVKFTLYRSVCSHCNAIFCLLHNSFYLGLAQHNLILRDKEECQVHRTCSCLVYNCYVRLKPPFICFHHIEYKLILYLARETSVLIRNGNSLQCWAPVVISGFLMGPYCSLFSFLCYVFSYYVVVLCHVPM
jgi:hypothetical protein